MQKNASGIYHLGPTNFCTNFEFARKIAQTFGLDESLVLGITLEEFSKTKIAYRAPYGWLDTGKFVHEFGAGILRTVEEDLIEFKHDQPKL
jgi:dTDP-4-dehydrorhamnose reductase